MAEDYVIIHPEELAREGGFLFWKPEAAGYTGDIDKAGVWEELPHDARNHIRISKKELLKRFKTKTIVVADREDLRELKKELVED